MVFGRPLSIAIVALAAASLGSAFYLPGFSPIEYQQDDKIDLKVNKLTSVKTQLPYWYYKLPYCRPTDDTGKDSIVDSVENLGETLAGDMIENSPYVIQMLKNTTCQLLCKKDLTAENKDTFRSMIEDEYLVNWLVDNLPAATRYQRPGAPAGEGFTYMDGFLVGIIDQKGHHYVHNHVTIDLKFHSNPDKYEGYRIVGFDIEPRSFSHKDGPNCPTSAAFLPFDLDDHESIHYTYDVQWSWSEVRWASRWDSYLKMSGGEIHWFAILNSLVIVLFLSGMVAMILLRTLHRDIAKYNELTTAEEAQEETGWKLVHGDVFRKPPMATLLAVSVGSGVQILLMCVVTLVFALLGFLSPAHRGGLLQSMMLLFTLMGVAAGYTSSRFCKVFDGDGGNWKLTTLMTALFYPGLFFGIFFLLNLCIWGQKSSGAVPFTTLFALLVLWFGVSVPLVFFGAYAGFRKPAIELPVRTNPVPRQVPEQPWFANPTFTSLIGGILPFGAVFTELFFIMTSLWQHQFYYLFGFLALVLCLVVVTCAEISIALVYFQLTAEDYNWWWPSFFGSGSSALYMFLYSILYFTSRLQITKMVSIMLYFGYMGIVSLMFMLVTGTIGTIATFFFVKAIYGSIKVD